MRPTRILELILLLSLSGARTVLSADTDSDFLLPLEDVTHEAPPNTRIGICDVVASPPEGVVYVGIVETYAVDEHWESTFGLWKISPAGQILRKSRIFEIPMLVNSPFGPPLSIPLALLSPGELLTAITHGDRNREVVGITQSADVRFRYPLPDPDPPRNLNAGRPFITGACPLPNKGTLLFGGVRGQAHAVRVDGNGENPMRWKLDVPEPGVYTDGLSWDDRQVMLCGISQNLDSERCQVWVFKADLDGKVSHRALFETKAALPASGPYSIAKLNSDKLALTYGQMSVHDQENTYAWRLRIFQEDLTEKADWLVGEASKFPGAARIHPTPHGLLISTTRMQKREQKRELVLLHAETGAVKARREFVLSGGGNIGSLSAVLGDTVLELGVDANGGEDKPGIVRIKRFKLSAQRAP